MANIPVDTCVDILTTDWGGKGIIDSISVTLEGEGGFSLSSFPVKTSNAITKCRFKGYSNKKISWYLNNQAFLNISTKECKLPISFI